MTVFLHPLFLPSLLVSRFSPPVSFGSAVPKLIDGRAEVIIVFTPAGPARVAHSAQLGRTPTVHASLSLDGGHCLILFTVALA